MDKDFHFYITGMLAKEAGFTADEAIVIATASQYTDDATESFTIHFDNGEQFKTTMTAHYHVRSFEEDVQKKVFMCFHFPPVGMITENNVQKFNYETRPNAPIINDLLHQILKDKELGTHTELITSRGNPFYLHRLGIAIHTLVDSWAHASFTGRHNDENDVGRIWFKKGSQWDRQHFNDWKWDVFPSVGHVECGPYPDQPFREWRYELYDTGEKKYRKIIRNNQEMFIEAAKACYGWLRKFKTGETGQLEESNPALQCLRIATAIKKDHENDRIKRLKSNGLFKQNYSVLFSKENDYTLNRWRDNALVAKDLLDPWGEVNRRKKLRARSNLNFGNSDFKFFHLAAQLQRAYILERLK
jgi:hypothetical protein